MANQSPWEYAGSVSLRDALNRLFEESVLRPGVMGGRESTNVAAPLDAYETDEGMVLKVVLPGVRAEDIQVVVTGEVLTIQGEFKEEPDDKRKKYLRQERRYGAFSRQLTLPAGLDASNVTADYENGILTLRLPKIEEVKPKSVKVSVKQ